MGTNDCCCGKWNAQEGSKIIGVTSTVISMLAIIGFVWELIKQARAESQLSSLLNSLGQLGDLTGDPQYNEVHESLKNRKISLGALTGIAFVCLLVAIALIFATKKNNRFLALPFMIWTILCTVGAGIFAACLAFFVAVADWTNEEHRDDYIRFFVVPLVFSVIMFALYTWWLVVVFNFYNRLKNGQAFDSIPMQTA